MRLQSQKRPVPGGRCQGAAYKYLSEALGAKWTSLCEDYDAWLYLGKGMTLKTRSWSTGYYGVTGRNHCIHVVDRRQMRSERGLDVQAPPQDRRDLNDITGAVLIGGDLGVLRLPAIEELGDKAIVFGLQAPQMRSCTCRKNIKLLLSLSSASSLGPAIQLHNAHLALRVLSKPSLLVVEVDITRSFFLSS